jgi:hypothetical protein
MKDVQNNNGADKAGTVHNWFQSMLVFNYFSTLEYYVVTKRRDLTLCYISEERNL